MGPLKKKKPESSSNVVNTFDKMMGASQAVNKLSKGKEEAINKLTGDAVEGVLNVHLQIDCDEHMLNSCIMTTVAQPDICAFCAAVGATKTVSLLENYHPKETQLNKLFQIIHRVLLNKSDMRKLIA
ncbi:uncharacterized protein [Mytilus edulis]|uniref:uncharacterized protein n=1 Tax=Mytilus edulis TaxID=6550 RepID=UPI0039EE14E0